jgi:hypothetical protein
MAGAGRFPRVDARGLPLADPRVERIGRILAAITSLWFLAAAAWEIAGPFGAGHYASSASVGIGGENIFHWGILGPVLEYTLRKPTSALYYCHHPWGIYWTTAVLVKLFGHHDLVCRLAPVLLSAATPPLLYGIGRALWGPIAGALSAASFVVLPIALAFADFNAFEVPTIFGVLLCTWGYVRLSQTWKRRFLVASLIGAFWAVNSDWPGFMFLAVVLAFMLPRGLLLRRFWYAPVDTRRFAQWWSIAASIAVVVLLFYIYEFQHAKQLAVFLTQGQIRASGASMSLDKVLESRKYWIEVSFTPLAIFLGKVALPLLVLRLVLLRRDLEVFPLAILVMATVQYLVFKEGADIHIFWPHYFAPYFGLAVGAIAASAEGAARWLVLRVRGAGGMLVPPLSALAVFIWVPLAILPDGIDGLNYARNTGGRFNENGRIIHQDVDKAALMKWLEPKMESHTSAAFDIAMRFQWSFAWELRRPVDPISPPPARRKTGTRQYFLVDTRFVSSDKELTSLADSFAVTAVGPYWTIDRGKPKAPIEGYVFQRREPSWFEWCLYQAHDPVYTIQKDAYHTWELRDSYGQEPNPAPQGPLLTPDQRRVAHNMALAGGDTALAAKLEQELVSDLDRSVAVRYDDGTELLGMSFDKGVAPRLTLYFKASGSEKNMEFEIRSEVEKKKKWSWVPADEKVRVVGMPFSIPSGLWKKGFIYTSVTEIRKRPGLERYYGYFHTVRGGTPPLPAKGGVRRTLLMLQ